jgi:hypothetical protein
MNKEVVFGILFGIDFAREFNVSIGFICDDKHKTENKKENFIFILFKIG